MLDRRSLSGLLAAGVVASITPELVQAEETPVAKNVVSLVSRPDVIMGLILAAAQR